MRFFNAFKKPRTWLTVIGVALVATLAVSLSIYGYNQWIQPGLDKLVNKETTEAAATALSMMASI